MITWIYWQTFLGNTYYTLSPMRVFALSTETPVLPFVGSYFALLAPWQARNIETNTDLIIAGALQQWFQNSTTAPSVQGIILMRSMFRFEFGGIFRRMN
jgi:hypothetical protein